MHRALVLLVLAALLVPPARAEHDGKHLYGAEMVPPGTRLNVTETGTQLVAASVNDGENSGSLVMDVQFSWHAQWRLSPDNETEDEPQFYSRSPREWSAKGTYHYQATSGGEVGNSDCTLDRSGVDLVDLRGVIDANETTFVISLDLGQDPLHVEPIGKPIWTCTTSGTAGVATHGEAYEVGMSRALPVRSVTMEHEGTPLGNATLLRKLGWNDDTRYQLGILDVTKVLPLPGQTLQFDFDRTYTLQPERAGASSRYDGETCSATHSLYQVANAEPTGNCRVASRTEVSTDFNYCLTVGAYRRAHERELSKWVRELNSDRKNATGGALPQAVLHTLHHDVWQPLTRDIIYADRTYQALGCGGSSETNALPELGGAWVALDVAYDRSVIKGKLDCAGLREAIEVDRETQLLGTFETNNLPEIIPALQKQKCPDAPPLDWLDVRVHSPVALHAYDEAGRHTGWDFAKNASVNDIPGSSYVGRPNESQVIKLPGRTYKIVVEELGPGNYSLQTSVGNETPTHDVAGQAFTSTPGRALVTAIGAAGDANATRLVTYPIWRGDAAAAPLGFRISLAPPVPLPQDDAVTDTAPTLPTAASQSPASQRPAAPKASPAGGLMGALVALVLVAAATRRRR